MFDIFRLYVDSGGNIQISLNIYLLVAIIFAILLIIFVRLIIKKKRSAIEISEMEVGIGKSKITLKPNYTDRQVAYKLWVEISTRKIGLEFEEDKDVIEDVYNSWYEFFGIARSTIKEIPVQKIHADNNENLAQISIKVLNLGLRPHLTEWQAKFRHWLDVSEDKYGNLSPQAIQKEYPEYDVLIEDLKETNGRLISYRRILYEIAFGKMDSTSS